MNKSKIMLIAAIGAVAILIGAGIVRCTFSPNEDLIQEPTAQQGQTQSETGSPDTPEGSETSGNEPTSTSAALVVDDYLNTNWTSEGSELSLLDGVFIEDNGTDSSPTYFAIEDATEKDNAITLTVWAAARPGDAGAQSIIVIDHSKDIPTITSDLFKNSHTYSLAPNEKSAIVIQAVTDDLNSYLEATTSDITSALTTYVAERLPGAGALSWTGEAYTDYFEGTRITTFLANDPAATIVTLTRASDGTLGVL